jgi:hypothetical protein
VATEANDEERNASEMVIRNFALRVFNRMSLDREVGGVQVASSLLQLPTYYAPHSESRHINLHYLRRRFEALICRSNGGDAINEEEIAVTSAARAQASVFDDYRCRDAMLKPLCIYEYVKLVRKRPPKNRTGGNRKTTVILGGPLSPYQHVEDSMQGGHPETLAMRNDLARTFYHYLYHGRIYRRPPTMSWAYAATGVMLIVTDQLTLAYKHVLWANINRSMCKTMHGMSGFFVSSRRTPRSIWQNGRPQRDALGSDDDDDDDYNDDYDGELDDSVQTNIEDDTLRLSYQVPSQETLEKRR